MHRRTSLTILALASSAALVAGCGSSSSGGTTTTPGGTGANDSSQSPSAELANALSALGDSSTLTTTIKLGATASDIKSLAASSGSSITDTVANAIAGAQIGIEVQAPSGKKLSDVGSGSTSGGTVDFTISDSGTNWLSLRSVNKTLYLQVDLKDLLSTIGKGSTLTELQSLEANPQFPSFAKALLDGKWVSLPESAASSLTGSTSSSSSPSPQQEQAILNGLKQVLTNDVTVTRVTTGATDVLQMRANSKKVLTDFLTTITTALPSAALALGSTDTSQIPSKKIVLGANVTGGALSQLSIDFGQFAPAKDQPQHLPLDLNFAETGPAITVPSGAVAVNTTQLAQLLGSFTGGLTSGG